MSLPSQDILDDIKVLITEITGFKENDENFKICERYCLSHVVHHTYPFVNKTTVRNLINSYVSRFYGHGYFKVSQQLNYQVKRFLSNEKLFEKNPQYDIQWSLLSLISSLSSNLTSVKEIPELLPIDDENTETNDINWFEYLTKDLPNQYPDVLSSDSEDLSKDDDENDEHSEKPQAETAKLLCQAKEKTEIIFDNRKLFDSVSASEMRRKRFEELLKSRMLRDDIESDYRLRGNISEKFDKLLSQEGINRSSQLLSELELMENILYQFQTGERMLLRKGLLNPALVSLTQETLSNYLESLQPYFKIIRCFKEFDAEVTEAKYPEKNQDLTPRLPKASQSSFSLSRRKKVPNVLYLYNAMLRKALEPFQQEVSSIVDSLSSYTLIRMERKLQPYFFDLTSLFYVHNLATKNWKPDCNWMSSIRILSVLYNAIMDATTSRMSFLYLNLFLRCFQVYLDIIDSWISSVELIDLNDEFIVTKADCAGKSDSSCTEFEIRPYKKEMENSGIKRVPILDFIGEKMIHVGQSLEILRRLNRFVTYAAGPPKESTYHSLLKSINDKIASLGKIQPKKPEPKPQEKKRSIFTMRNSNLMLVRDGGGGDCSTIGSLLLDEMKEKEEETHAEAPAVEDDGCGYSCKEFIYSTIRNPFFKMAFEGVGMEEVRRRLEEMKVKGLDETEDLMVVKKGEEETSGVYPFHKIISESFHQTFGSRVSDACALVKDIVLKECDLLSHLSLLRSVLLFNNAYLIQPFILALFTQPVIWESSYSLTLHLKECLKGLLENHANDLTVTLAKDTTTKCETVLQVIDVITVNYEVKWPLTLIFTPEVMDKYNNIFRLALKLKWAHWAMSGLHFRGEDENQSKVSKSTLHSIHLLRFWLLSALSRINNYFMAQMLPWNLELNSCRDFKEIISVHSDFIERVCRNCLLRDKCPEGRNLIFQTLIPLCMDLWTEGGIVTDEKLASMEKVFGNCHLLLSRFMSSLEEE